MRNIVVNDNILFEANLKDPDGTTITNAIGSLSVRDFTGSLVLGTNLAHVSNGTYRFTASTSGWAPGPLTETWHFYTGSGTSTEIANNNFRIVGTDTITPYIYPEELPVYYENIADYYDGSQEAIIVDACSEINSRLEALGVKLPIKPKADGFYDQALRDLNAYEALIRIVSKRQQAYNRDGDKEPWFMTFRKEADRVYKGIANKTYNFDRDTSVAEGGIGLATKVSGGTRAQMETNWRGGVGNGFTDSSYERDWVLTVRGTGTAGEIEECSFTWSNDGGVSEAGTLTTSKNWQELCYGVFVRFYRGTYTGGTVNLFAVGDKWTFKTFPKAQAVGGKRSARSY